MRPLADDTLELRPPPGFVVDAFEQAYLFEMLLRGTTTRVGEISLRVDRSDPALIGYAGHVGYEVALPHRGRRHALRACRLLAPFARELGFRELWLTVSPENAASCRTLDLLGARYVDTVRVPVGTQMHVLGMHRVRRYCWTL